MRVRGALAAVLCVVGVAAVGTGPALADPDQPPVDPQVVDVPPPPPPPAPWEPRRWSCRRRPRRISVTWRLPASRHRRPG